MWCIFESLTTIKGFAKERMFNIFLFLTGLKTYIVVLWSLKIVAQILRRKCFGFYNIFSISSKKEIYHKGKRMILSDLRGQGTKISALRFCKIFLWNPTKSVRCDFYLQKFDWSFSSYGNIFFYFSVYLIYKTARSFSLTCNIRH